MSVPTIMLCHLNLNLKTFGYKMKRRVYSNSIVITLYIMSWVFATSFPFAVCESAHQEGYIFHNPQAVLESKQGIDSMERVERNEEVYKGLSALGSRPPNCEHKCGGCKPCNAIQVPKTTGHLGVQYANYEPEGWKCKCGTSFSNKSNP